MKDELIKISLQFFGVDGEDDFDDYDDDWDEDEDEGKPDEDNSGDADKGGDNDASKGDGGAGEDGSDDEDDEDVDDDDESDDEDVDNDDDPKDAPEKKDADEKGEEVSETDALMAELKALGYEGNDLKSITASMKRKREAAEAAERRAANREGKAHVKAGTPSKSASGDGVSGFTQRDIEEMKAAIGNGCTDERARRALEKRIRAMAR